MSDRPSPPHTRGPKSFLNALYRGTSVIRSNLPTFLILEALFHTTILLAMLVTYHQPYLHELCLDHADSQLQSSHIGRLALRAYDKKTGSIFLAAPITLIINILIGSLFYITVPSVVVPYVGLPLLGVRAVMWGLLFPPFAEGSSVFHYATMLLEGQAYVVAALGCYLQSGDIARQWLRGREGGRWKKPWELDWRFSWRVTKGLYPLILSVLGVAAVWEAIEVIHLS